MVKPLETKQVIILRKDLNMRKGKCVAQGCHASLDAVIEATREQLESWQKDGNSKICVSCDSEQELMDIYQKAVEAKLPASFIVDSGRTEFHGQKTATAVGIGPANAIEIDKITGNLKLL